MAEWQFWKYELQIWCDHEIRSSPSCNSRILLFYILSNLHFRSPSFHGGAPSDFSCFCLVFTIFMHIWQHPMWDLRFECIWYIGQLILLILLTWNNTRWCGFRIYISQHRFTFHWSFEISFLLLICVLRIHKLGFLIFDVLFQIWSAWLFHFDV